MTPPPVGIASMRRRPDLFDAIVAGAIVAATITILWLGRGLTFFADEWAVIGDRPLGLDTFLRPFNEHWLGVTTFVHRLLVESIGLGSYLPYLALLVALHAIVVAEVYVLARRSTWPVIAAGIAIVAAFFGSGFENLFWAMQIGFVGAIAMGFAALLLLDGRPSAGRAVVATGLLTAGVMTSGFGLFMLALVGLDLLLDRERRRLILAVVVPTVVYGAWYLVLGRSGVATHGDPFTAQSLAAVPAFIFEGAAEALSSAFGVGRPIGRIGVVLVVAVIVVRLVRREPVSPRALACFGAIVAQYALLALVRGQMEADATYFSRYSYLSGMFALLGIAALLGRPAMPVRPRPRLLVVAALGALLVLSLVWNVRLLVAGRSLFGERADLTRAMVEIGLQPVLPDGVDPKLSLVLVPSPVRLAAIVERYGSPLADSLAGDAVPPISDTARAEALLRATHPPDWLLANPTLP
jgi:hypothetical protein